MAKVTLNSITSSRGSTDLLNANFTALATAIENTLSRDGTTPNTMSADLDMNSNDILNLNSLDVDSLSIGGTLVTTTELAETALPSQTDKEGRYLYTNGTSASWIAPPKYVVDSVSAMDALTYLDVGDIVQTLGYSSVGDGGDNLYEIVAAATGTEDGGRWIDLSGSSLQAKGLFPSGYINVKHFGCAGDGVTDDRAAFQAAIDYVESLTYPSKLHVPAGDYLIDRPAGGNGLSITAALHLEGDGTYQSNIIVEFATTTSGNGIVITSSNVKISNLTVDVNCDAAGTVILMLNDPAHNFMLDSCKITGTRSFDTQYWPHGIKLADDVDAADCIITNCDFEGLNFILFTANAFGTTGNQAVRWRITGNTFTAATAGISWNTDFATSGVAVAWDDITFTGNTVRNLKGPIGGDGMANVTCSGNTFSGSNVGDGECAIHFENMGENIVVANNVIDVTSGGGILCYSLTRNFSITGNTIIGEAPTRDETTDPATLGDPSTDSVGIYCVTDGDGQPENVSITGNSIMGCTYGIMATSLLDNIVVTGNSISYCNAGIFLNAGGGEGVQGNTITLCKYVYSIGGNKSVIGKNTAIDCTNLFYNKTDHVALNGLVWHVDESASLSTGVTTDVSLFEDPARADCTVCSYIQQTSAGSNHEYSVSSFDIDNTPTVTATKDRSLLVGSIVLNGTPFTVASSLLKIRILNSSGSTQTVRMKVNFDGFLLFD